jgi:signal transduction histidine kinase
MTAIHSAAYPVPARLAGRPPSGLRYTPSSATAASPPARPAAAPAISTQESLVNAAKHAAGQPVAVRLDYGGAGIRLTVRNELTPDAAAPPAASMRTVNGGYGLAGMRERLRLLHGTLEAGRRGGQWVVTAELPRLSPGGAAS